MVIRLGRLGQIHEGIFTVPSQRDHKPEGISKGELVGDLSAIKTVDINTVCNNCINTVLWNNFLLRCSTTVLHKTVSSHWFCHYSALQELFAILLYQRILIASLPSYSASQYFTTCFIRMCLNASLQCFTTTFRHSPQQVCFTKHVVTLPHCIASQVKVLPHYSHQGASHFFTTVLHKLLHCTVSLKCFTIVFCYTFILVLYNRCRQNYNFSNRALVFSWLYKLSKKCRPPL